MPRLSHRYGTYLPLLSAGEGLRRLLDLCFFLFFLLFLSSSEELEGDNSLLDKEEDDLFLFFGLDFFLLESLASSFSLSLCSLSSLSFLNIPSVCSLSLEEKYWSMLLNRDALERAVWGAGSA